MHLQENTLFDIELGTKATHSIDKYPLHHVTYASSKMFEVATSKMHLQENTLFDLSPLHFDQYHKTQILVLLDFSLTVKAAPHECEIRTGQP